MDEGPSISYLTLLTYSPDLWEMCRYPKEERTYILYPALGFVPHMRVLERSEKVFCFKHIEHPQRATNLCFIQPKPCQGSEGHSKAVLIVSSCIRQEPKHKSRQQMIAYSAKDAEWTGPTVNLGQVTYYLGGKSEF